MSLDPQAQKLLDAAAKMGLAPVYHLSVPDARKRMITAFTANYVPKPIFKVEDLVIPGPEANIPIRIYTPLDDDHLPILVFCHGGGGVINNLETHDRLCRSISEQANCIVISVDYRLAPEHKYPAGLVDVYTATQWAANNASKIGGDPERIAVGGDSSGGQLATSVALLSRDRGGPKIVFQVLAYPVTDYFWPGTSSYQEFATGYSLNRDFMIWFWNHFIESDADLSDPYLCPLRAKNLEGLPPALIMTANFDPLRDEGRKYAERLQAAGNVVEYRNYEGMMHGFLLQPSLDVGVAAITEIAEALKAVFQ